MRRTVVPLLAATLMLPPAAMAQTAPGDTPQKPSAPLESITVIATRPSEAVIDHFIFSRAAPARVTGKLARWKKGICPQTIGLGPRFAKYVSDRIREVAAAVSAPVDGDVSCKPNIEVVFTTAPQGLLDNVRKSQPVFLGYHDNGDQADALAKVTHAMQSWYTTATDDMRGRPEVDSGASGGMTINIQPIQVPGGGIQGPTGTLTLTLPHASAQTVTGSRLGDGLSTELYNVLIVAEPAKLMTYEIGTLADYAAMLALAQPSALDSCEELPSISNLLAKDCAAATDHLTDGDLAYLRSLYRMGTADTLAMQRDTIRFQMEKTLVTDKSGQ
ncbi:MAG TPA: hypothetical protein VHX18_00180 [Rhizomicrobium sp.]|jgi:hypothetical protein|nr:hypothetical protein [Rhizomicrobium sp.]